MEGPTEEARERLLDGLSLVDDDVANAYLESGDVPTELLKAALRKATIALKAVPVLCGSGLKNKGIQPLLDAVVDYLPAPTDMPPIQGVHPDTQAPLSRNHDPKDPFSALVFKVQMVENRKIVYVRVYSGRLPAGDEVYNVRAKVKRRAIHLYRMQGIDKEAVEEATVGDILVMDGLKDAVTGDTLVAPGQLILLESIEKKVPVITVAIEPEKHSERDKLLEVLQKFTEEDPSFAFQEDKGTGQIVIRGMGELHLEIIADRIKREHNLAAKLSPPSVVFRETILGKADAQGTFERDTDTEHIFGQVQAHVEPAPRGTGNTVSLTVADPRLRDDLKALLKAGAEDAFSAGPLQGDQVDDVKVTLTGVTFRDGSPLTPIGYRIAAGIATREAIAKAHPSLLEPIMKVEITVPEAHLGDIIGDLGQRGARIEDIQDQGGSKVVLSLVSLRHMFGYTTRLRSMTEGRGAYTMTFQAYDTNTHG
jgi:elongation factor G